MRRWLVLIGCAMGLVLAAAACGGDDKAASTTTTVRATATTVAASSGQSTTTAAATGGQSTTTAASANATACALVPIDEVIAATKVAANAASTQAGKTNCLYSGPTGIFFAIDIQTLTKGDQATFDAKVKGQESGTVTSLSGIGEGNGALAKHTDNVKAYARKGTTVVAITVFNTAADPTNNAQSLLRNAIGRV